MNGLGNKIVLSVLTPRTITESGIHLPNATLTIVSGKKFTNAVESKLDTLGAANDKEAEEMMADAAAGVHVWREKNKSRVHALGLVIGENLHLKLPVFDTQPLNGFNVPPRVRFMERMDSPRFGDVIMFVQKYATDWSGFYKMPCDTTPRNEFVLCDTMEKRFMQVSRNADVTIIEVSDTNTPLIVRKWEPPGTTT